MTNRMHAAVRFNRLDRLKERLLQWTLGLRFSDQTRRRPMVSIIGDYVSDQIRAEGLYESRSLEIVRNRFLNLEECRTQVAIDVGANIGNHTLFYSDLFRKVIAFEPNPLARSLLQINVELNHATNIDIRAVGLSDRPGTTSLSFDLHNLGATRTAESGGAAQVELVVGDAALSGTDRIGLIKIDVEGAEAAVLKGLEQTIRRDAPIVMIEQLQSAIDPRSGTSPAFNFLRELGFTAWDYRTARIGGPIGRLMSLAMARSKYIIEPVGRLESRDYEALIFTPPSYSFPQPS